jgi:hypothetical protein
VNDRGALMLFGLEPAELAIAISVLALLVSAVQLGWSIRSVFLYPKPKIEVKSSFVYPINTPVNVEALQVTAVNHGPNSAQLENFAYFEVGFGKKHRTAIPWVYSNYPHSNHRGLGAPGLPLILEPGEAVTVYVHLSTELGSSFKKGRFGFNDSFGRRHLDRHLSSRKLK